MAPLRFDTFFFSRYVRAGCLLLQHIFQRAPHYTGCMYKPLYSTHTKSLSVDSLEMGTECPTLTLLLTVQYVSYSLCMYSVCVCVRIDASQGHTWQDTILHFLSPLLSVLVSFIFLSTLFLCSLPADDCVSARLSSPRSLARLCVTFKATVTTIMTTIRLVKQTSRDICYFLFPPD